jgi:diadenosine tetraphosphate (Ap4A) HIT family hydrolase
MAYYNENAAHGPEHLEEMKRLNKKGICIFCPEHIHEDKEKLELETDHWMVKNNAFPRPHTLINLLFIPKQHVNTISKLSAPAQAELMPLISKFEKKLKLKSYAIVIRSGDMRYNGGSLEHLHVHLVVGDTDSPEHEPVRYKLSSRPN